MGAPRRLKAELRWILSGRIAILLYLRWEGDPHGRVRVPLALYINQLLLKCMWIRTIDPRTVWYASDSNVYSWAPR